MRVDVSEYVDSVPKYGRRLWTNRCVCTFNFHRCKRISTRGVYAHVDVISSYQSTWFTAVSLHLFSVLWHLSSVCPIDQFVLPILFRWSPFELKLVHFVLVLGYLNSFDVGLFKLIGLVWVVDWIYNRYLKKKSISSFGVIEFDDYLIWVVIWSQFFWITSQILELIWFNVMIIWIGLLLEVNFFELLIKYWS